MSDNRCCTSKCITDFKCNTKTNKCIVNGKDSTYLCKKDSDCGAKVKCANAEDCQTAGAGSCGTDGTCQNSLPYCEGTLNMPGMPWICQNNEDCGRCSNGGWQHFFPPSPTPPEWGLGVLPIGTTCNGCCAVYPDGEDLVKGRKDGGGWCNMQDIPKYGAQGYGSNMDYANLFAGGTGAKNHCKGNVCGRTSCENNPWDQGPGRPNAPILHWCGASDLAQCKNGTCKGCIIDGICQDSMPQQTQGGGPPPTTEGACMALGKSPGSYLPATWCGEGGPTQNNWAQKDCLQQCPNCSGNGADDSGPACSYQGEANINMCNKCKNGYSGICCQIGPEYVKEKDKCSHMTEKECTKSISKDWKCMWDPVYGVEGPGQCYSVTRDESVKDWPVPFCAERSYGCDTTTGKCVEGEGTQTQSDCSNSCKPAPGPLYGCDTTTGKCVKGKGKQTQSDCSNSCKIGPGPKPPSTDKKMSVGIIILIVALCILVLLSIFFYFRNR